MVKIRLSLINSCHAQLTYLRASVEIRSAPVGCSAARGRVESGGLSVEGATTGIQKSKVAGRLALRVEALAQTVNSPALNHEFVALMTIHAALVAIYAALVAIQGAPVGKNLAQVVSQAALIRFYRALEAKNRPPLEIQAALIGKQLAQLVSKAALFISHALGR